MPSLIIIFGVIIVLFLIIGIADGLSFYSIILDIKHVNIEVITNLLANAGGELTIGLFGITMSVIAFTVELAANRYTPKVTELFFKDKINIIVMHLLATTVISLIITVYLTRHNMVPVWLANITVLLVLISSAIILPYYFYIFSFIKPLNILSKIRHELNDHINQLKNPNIPIAKLRELQISTVYAIDQVIDISLNSVVNKDKIIATNAIKLLRDLIIHYLSIKSDKIANELWFEVPKELITNNTDFAILSKPSIEELKKEKIWLEHKILRQISTVFNQSLNVLRDISTFIGQALRLIGVAAINYQDEKCKLLVVRYFNTLLRSSINAKDVRTAYNLLYQYREYALELMELGDNNLVVRIANHFKYYGMLAKDKGLPFVLETVAYDLCDINKRAYEAMNPIHEHLLDIILTVDLPLEGPTKEESLRGIRKAQLMLAAYYLRFWLEQKDTKSFAIFKKIYFDILDEVNRPYGYSRIATMIGELKYVKKEFWEIIDRGINFEYMEDKYKAMLPEIFELYTSRQILLYAHMRYQGDDDKALHILNEIKDYISLLPDKVPPEHKDFEVIYGEYNLDDKTGAVLSIYHTAVKLLSIPSILDYLKNYGDQQLPLPTPDNAEELQKWVEEFTKIIASEYSDYLPF